MSNLYPIKIRVSKQFREELENSEYGRFEDAEHARNQGDEESIRLNNYELVVCDFINRGKTFIELHSQEESNELYYALGSGTTCLMCPDTGRGLYRQGDRVMNEIKHLVSEGVASKYHCANRY